jgi:hypothetical protein
MDNSNLNFYSRNFSGHRKSYYELLSNELNGELTSLRIGVFSKKTQFFLMIEDSFFLFLFVGIIRAMFGLKTIGLLFRVKNCLEPTYFNAYIKKLCLKFIKPIKNIHTLSLLPFEIDERAESVCDGWIYDPQFWDLKTSDLKLYEKFSKNNVDRFDTISEQGFSDIVGLFKLNKSKVEHSIVSIGEQTRIKGFERLMDLFDSDLTFFSRFDFCYGGRVERELNNKLNKQRNMRFQGLNKRLSDDEIIIFYAFADFIWCSYTEDYDQASGIFGRALQFNKTVIIRKNSYLHSLCLIEDIPHISLEYKNGELINANDIRIIDSGFSTKFTTNYRKVKSINTLIKIIE